MTCILLNYFHAIQFSLSIISNKKVNKRTDNVIDKINVLFRKFTKFYLILF
jgi:DNA polymerase sigma